MNIVQWVKHTTEYTDYLKSKEWRAKRREIFKTRSECECCWEAKYLQVHHLHYKNIFCENLEKDLVVLCKLCHKMVHVWFDSRPNKSKSLEDITHDMIRSYKHKLKKDWTIKNEWWKNTKKYKARLERKRKKMENKKIKSSENYNYSKKKFEYVPYVNKKKLRMNDIIAIHWLKVAMKEEKPKRETIAQRLARLKKEASL